jgi:CheY-like chemotaxis protein
MKLPHVLLVGNVGQLQRPRKQLFEDLGFAVSTTGSVAGLLQVCESQPVEMIVVCYSMKATQCRRILACVQDHRLNAKIVLLAAIMDPHLFAHEFVSGNVIQTPEEFSLAIQDLLQMALLHRSVPGMVN